METRDIQFAADPRNWPRWPWLPMKRYIGYPKGGGSPYDCAVLHADTDPNTKPIKLWRVILFQIDCYFPRPEWEVAAEFPDWRAFAQSDWKID